MPTKQEWIRIHADLMEKLGLPCELRLSSSGVKIGCHFFENDRKNCCIKINPKADFRVPEHLILHEAAHHRSLCYVDWDCGDQHCEHWAKTLLDMYKETGTPLPQTTGFFEFAKIARIIRKNFATEGENA